MRGFLKRKLTRAGIYYSKRQYMPCGIDWLWDIERLAKTKRLSSVFDVGANIGQTTVAIKSRFEVMDIHAFEPVMATHLLLKKNVSNLSGITCHRLALSDACGTGAITCGSNSLVNHLVELSNREVVSTETVEETATDTVDNFCQTRGIREIDILKVDTEGADLKVLLGAENMLRRGQVRFVLAEVGFEPSDSGHVYLAEVFAYLFSVGLKPYSFYDYCRLRPPSYEEEGVGLTFANVLFVKPAP